MRLISKANRNLVKCQFYQTCIKTLRGRVEIRVFRLWSEWMTAYQLILIYGTESLQNHPTVSETRSFYF